MRADFQYLGVGYAFAVAANQIDGLAQITTAIVSATYLLLGLTELLTKDRP